MSVKLSKTVIRFLLKALNKVGLLKFLHFSLPIQVDQSHFSIPIHKGVGLHNFFMDEWWMVDILHLFKGEISGFTDVGANVGQSLLKFKAVYPKLPYWAFEPNKTCISYLESLSKKNNFAQVSFHPYALSNNNGSAELHFFMNESTDRAASLDSNHLKEKEIVKSSSVDIKSTVESLGFINQTNLVKVDVERHEFKILEGIFRLNKRNPILVEILPMNSEIDKERINKINQLISINNYSLFRIEKKEMRLRSFTVLALLENDHSIDQSDFLLMAKEDKKLLNVISKHV